MIEKLDYSRNDRLALRFSGTITEEDYAKTLIPALEEAIEAEDHIRLLARVESNVGDFTLGAMLQDARIGLKHWRGFDRVAVVTDSGWIKKAISALGIFMPCPVQMFPLAEEETARRWLSESLGTIHQTDLGGGVLHVQLRGKLDPAAYAEEAQDLDAFIRKNNGLRLLLDLRDFDGWQGLAGVAEHLKLVRDHRKQVDRAAIVGSGAFAQIARRLGDGLINAQVRHFDADALEDAKTWIAAG